MNPDSERILKALEDLTQGKKIEFKLYNHDDSSYFEPFYHDARRYGKQLNVWSLLSVEARLKPVKPVVAVEAWKNLESEGTYYLNSCRPPHNTRLYHESSSDEIIRGYQNAEEAACRAAKYQELLGLLQTQCRRLTALEVSDIGSGLKLSPTLQRRYADLTYYSVCILIGQIEDNTWICLCPSAPIETRVDDSEFSHIPRIFDPIELSISKAQAFQDQIDRALGALSPMQIYGCSDQENIFEHKILYEIGRTEEDAVARVFCKSGILHTGEFKSFYSDQKRFSEAYGNYYYDNWDSEEGCRKAYENLYLYLVNNLLNLTFYRYSLWIHEHIYIVGQAQSEDWLGVKLYSTYTDNP